MTGLLLNFKDVKLSWKCLLPDRRSLAIHLSRRPGASYRLEPEPSRLRSYYRNETGLEQKWAGGREKLSTAPSGRWCAEIKHEWLEP